MHVPQVGEVYQVYDQLLQLSDVAGFIPASQFELETVEPSLLRHVTDRVLTPFVHVPQVGEAYQVYDQLLQLSDVAGFIPASQFELETVEPSLLRHVTDRVLTPFVHVPQVGEAYQVYDQLLQLSDVAGFIPASQ